MKIQMVARISGTRNGEDWPAPGETIDVPADEAQALIDAKIATELKRSAPRVETATAPAAETAKTALGKANTGL